MNLNFLYFIEGIQSMISYEVIHVLDHIRSTGNTWFRKRNIGKYDVKFNSIFFVQNQSQTNFCFKDSFFVFHLTSIMLIQSIIVCE